jgi:cbb3-type cytochrome oxidase subunit 1
MKTDFSKWERIRTKGRLRYIVIYGVLCYGIGTAVLFSIIFPLLMSWMSREVSFSRVLLLSLILFPLGGIAWGATMWYVMENKHHKASEASAPPDA